MSTPMLGPNHKYLGDPLGPASTATGRPRTGRPVRETAAAPEIVVMAGSTADADGHPRYSLTQILLAYAAAHDRAAGASGPCQCLLCADLRWHINQQAHAAERRQP